MIKQLNLNRYGKFTDESFEFGKVTLFRGENEAGKTTIFDSLLEEVCGPSGNTKDGRYLRGRYGENRDVSADYLAEKISLEVAEFRNLYAVGASELSVEFASDAEWMDRVKAALFSGGIDPEPIKVALETRASTRGTYAHNRNLATLEKERDLEIERLSELQRQRDEVRNSENQVDPLRDGIAENERQIRDLSNEKAQFEIELALEKKITDRNQLSITLALIGKREELANNLDSSSRLKEDETPEVDRLEKDLEGTRSVLGTKRAALTRDHADLEAVEAEIQSENKVLETVKMSSEKAAELRERIQGFRSESTVGVTTTWRSEYLVLAAVGALASLGYAISGTSGSALPIVLVGGLIWAAVFVFFAKKTSTSIGGTDEKESVKNLLEEWVLAGGVASDSVETLTDLENLLVDEIARFRALKVGSEQTEKRRAKLEGDIKAVGSQIKELEAAVSAKEAELKNWFGERMVADRDDYNRKYSQRKEMEKGLAESQAILADRLSEYDCEDIDELKRECERKLRGMDEDGVPRKGRSELEQRQLQKQIENLSEKIGHQESHVRQDTETLRTTEGLVKGSLGGIPEDIFRAESRIRNVEANIKANLLEREAAGLAAQIFGNISEGADEVLVELGEEIGREFQEITGAGRQVALESLDGNSILLTDAGGMSRPVGDVSRGTRDSFMLAARLALARHAADGERLLVFDEPFVAFDEKRLNHAIGMLKNFQNETSWQIIMLTKDDQVVEAFRRSFPVDDLIEHQLTVGK